MPAAAPLSVAIIPRSATPAGRNVNVLPSAATVALNVTASVTPDPPAEKTTHRPVAPPLNPVVDTVTR